MKKSSLLTGKGGVVLLKSNEAVCRSDFAIKTVTLVEAGLLTGYQTNVTRCVDRKTRYIQVF